MMLVLQQDSVRDDIPRVARSRPSCSSGRAVLAIFGPWLAPYPGDAAASHLLRRLKPPSAAFPFGTDNLGRDIFSRVILGARGALECRLSVVGLADGDRRAAGPDRRLPQRLGLRADHAHHRRLSWPAAADLGTGAGAIA